MRRQNQAPSKARTQAHRRALATPTLPVADAVARRRAGVPSRQRGSGRTPMRLAMQRARRCLRPAQAAWERTRRCPPAARAARWERARRCLSLSLAATRQTQAALRPAQRCPPAARAARWERVRRRLPVAQAAGWERGQRCLRLPLATSWQAQGALRPAQAAWERTWRCLQQAQATARGRAHPHLPPVETRAHPRLRQVLRSREPPVETRAHPRLRLTLAKVRETAPFHLPPTLAEARSVARSCLQQDSVRSRLYQVLAAPQKTPAHALAGE